MKTLITEKCVQEAIDKGQKTICVDENTLITPAARDKIRIEGLEIVEGGAPCCEAAPAPAPAAPAPQAPAAEGLNSEMIYQLLSTLAEKGLLDGFLAGLNGAQAQPYVAERDGGFKIVKGNTVRMDFFETGTPEADAGQKVTYQEVNGADDGASTNAGFLSIDHTSFAYDVEIQETYYVIEGNMIVTIDGRAHTAGPGDVLYIPAGSKVQFSSGDTKLKAFYSTY